MHRGEDGRAYSDEREDNKRKEEYILDMVGLNPMRDPEDELLYEENNSKEFTVRIKKPRRNSGVDIDELMRIANSVMKNIDTDEDVTLEIAVTATDDPSKVGINKIRISNDDKESDKKNK